MKIYCNGHEAEIVPVVLATLTINGRLRTSHNSVSKPLYHVCSECGDVVPDTLAVR